MKFKEFKEKIKVLELFAGTKSFSKELDKDKYEVPSLDILKKFNPDVCIDIMQLDYKNLNFKPDIIWSSPPCTEYSHAKRRGVRDIEGANKIVKRTLEIINYFKPKYWFLENPQTGLLKDQEFMKGLPYVDVSYCKYGFNYRKQTRIWTNLNNWQGKTCNKDCHAIIKEGNRRRHKTSFGNGRSKYTDDKSFSDSKKYAMPSKLMKEIINLISYE